MSKSVSKHIATYLADESSLGLVIGTNLFVESEPTTPNESVTIYNTSGATPSHTIDSDTRYSYMSVQVRVRADSQADGYDTIYDIVDYLDGKNNITIDSMAYKLILMKSEVMFLEFDTRNRPIMVVNFDIQRIN